MPRKKKRPSLRETSVPDLDGLSLRIVLTVVQDGKPIQEQTLTLNHHRKGSWSTRKRDTTPVVGADQNRVLETLQKAAKPLTLQAIVAKLGDGKSCVAWRRVVLRMCQRAMIVRVGWGRYAHPMLEVSKRQTEPLLF